MFCLLCLYFNCFTKLVFRSLIYVHEMLQVVRYFAHGSGSEVLWWARLCVCVSVCLSVCLSASISPEPHARSLAIFLCMLPMSVARTCSGRLTKSQGEGTVFRGDFLLHWQCIVTRSLQITSCSRRDHSIATGEWWERTARAKCDLRLPCWFTAKWPLFS